MNKTQAKELFTLITTVRHVKVMDVHIGANAATLPLPGCLLCEGVRHKLYDEQQGSILDMPTAFGNHFGCTDNEANQVLFHNQLRSNYATIGNSTGENYYQAGKELLIKYGYNNLFETTLSFSDLMDGLMDKRKIEVTHDGTIQARRQEQEIRT